MFSSCVAGIRISLWKKCVNSFTIHCQKTTLRRSGKKKKKTLTSQKDSIFNQPQQCNIHLGHCWVILCNCTYSHVTLISTNIWKQIQCGWHQSLRLSSNNHHCFGKYIYSNFWINLVMSTISTCFCLKKKIKKRHIWEHFIFYSSITKDKRKKAHN